MLGHSADSPSYFCWLHIFQCHAVEAKANTYTAAAAAAVNRYVFYYAKIENS